jgi:uncharacterized protein
MSRTHQILHDFTDLKEGDRLNPGVFMRLVSATQLPHDLIKMQDAKSTFFMPATLISEGIPITLIGKSVVDNRWRELSGIVLSTRTTKAPFASKYDTHSEELLDVKREGLSTKRQFTVPIDFNGEIDSKKMQRRSQDLRQRGIGAKLKTDIRALREKMNEQKERIFSSEVTYYTSKGREKVNKDKNYIETYGTILQNEVLTLPKPDDIAGIYLNMISAKSISEAIKIKRILDRHNDTLDYFVYNSQLAALRLIARNAMPLDIPVDQLPDLSQKINELLREPYIDVDEVIQLIAVTGSLFTYLDTTENLDYRIVADFLLQGADSNAQNFSGQTVFMLALKKRHFDTIKILLERGAIIDLGDKQKQTVLALARESKQDNIITLIENTLKLLDLIKSTPKPADYLEQLSALIASGAIVNARDKNGMTPLLYAVKNNSLSDVKWLLQAGANPNLCDQLGFTSLMYAVNKGDLEIICLLLPHIKMDARNHLDHSALNIAIHNGNTNAAQLLIAAKANINTFDHANNTLIMQAMQNKALGIVALLLDAKVKDLHHCNYQGENILDLAIKVPNNLAIIEILLSYRPPISANRALFSACKNGDEKLAALILEKGRCPDNLQILVEYCGPKVYDLAAQRNYKELCQLSKQCRSLLKDYWELFSRPEKIIKYLQIGTHVPKSLLIDEAQKQKSFYIQLFLEHGANPNTVDNDDRTLLMLAVQSNNQEMVSLLITHKVNVDAVNRNNGRTALMYAAAIGRKEICEILLQYKTNVLLQDKNGYNAVDIAREYGHADIAALLEPHLASQTVAAKEQEQKSFRHSIPQRLFGNHVPRPARDLSALFKDYDSASFYLDRLCDDVKPKIKIRNLFEKIVQFKNDKQRAAAISAIRQKASEDKSLKSILMTLSKEIGEEITMIKAAKQDADYFKVKLLEATEDVVHLILTKTEELQSRFAMI